MYLFLHHQPNYSDSYIMNNQIQNQRLLACLWLIRVLQKYKRMTLEEIREKWDQSDFRRRGSLPRKTFIDLRNDTEELLHLEIGCDRKDNYRYYIANQDDSQISDWLISSFSISSLSNEQQEVRDRILLEAPPLGIEHFDLIVDAFREGYAMEMKYQKFTDSEPYTCFIEPYCLKHDHHRWYLLARKDHRDHLQTFALDRILELTLLKNCPFSPEPDFSPRQHFAHSFGVFVGQQEPLNIRVRAYGVGRDYLRTAPLHSSQKESVISNDISDFSIYCRPTRDLMLHLLSQGADIEVMQPDSLREEISNEAKRIADKYS